MDKSQILRTMSAYNMLSQVKLPPNTKYDNLHKSTTSIRPIHTRKLTKISSIKGGNTQPTTILVWAPLDTNAK